MTTLRIEHAIHDYDQWKAAFDNFAQVRANAGVRGHAIRRPVEDPHYLMLDLEFDTADAAGKFAAVPGAAGLVLTGFRPRTRWRASYPSPRTPGNRLGDRRPGRDGLNSAIVAQICGVSWGGGASRSVDSRWSPCRA